jgi:hypothetical protein
MPVLSSRERLLSTGVPNSFDRHRLPNAGQSVHFVELHLLCGIVDGELLGLSKTRRVSGLPVGLHNVLARGEEKITKLHLLTHKRNFGHPQLIKDFEGVSCPGARGAYTFDALHDEVRYGQRDQ